MRELFIYAKPKYGGVIKETPIPKPGPKEVLIKVVYAGLNPKDWKATQNLTEPEAFNTGDDVAGIVEAVGSEVFEFKPGDRVAGFHQMRSPHGTYAEYTVVRAATTFHLPPNISFESGASLPLAFMTAAIALYQGLKVPLPTALPEADGEKTPILIWGGATAVGAFALQLAKLSNLGPIITVAGDGIDFVKSLNVADHIIDYRTGDVAQKIIAAAGSAKIKLAFDSISDPRSYEPISKILAASGGGVINMVDPIYDRNWKFPDSVKLSSTMVGSAHGDTWGRVSDEQAKVDSEFAYWFYRYLSHLLAEGRIKPHPVEVLPDGLAGIVAGVQALFDRKVSAKKLVARIGE
ncbi:trans-enoyl reductase fsr4 [Trichoderma asperellum]|uniref:Trans-enoyl reductase fsr4 n=1 Tax=Trichoderma asperellum TaxID=101201 RepID=A0A6V8QRX2_TRIAP|nr:GroES-like protein [Trichoderma asperelloides]GFP54556.1 trans-enoyl reductase fsr4 [Trichoderma asperellum]